jgi:NADPH-dependent curcumin reductase CurA
VVGALGWQLYGVADGNALQKVDASMIPLSAYLGPVGMPGVTAWVGLNDICAPKEGETVVVTAASGAVGSVVGQLAKLKGARAVGIAGGAEKCRYVVEELGFDACIDYKAGNLRGDLKTATPKGIDCLFENVGGEIFDTLLGRMNPFARIAVCGLIAQYNSAPYPMQNIGSVLINRIRMQGFIVSDDMSRWPPALKELGMPGRHRQAQVPRDRRRRPRRRTRRLHQPAQGRQLRQATGEARLTMSNAHIRAPARSPTRMDSTPPASRRG